MSKHNYHDCECKHVHLAFCEKCKVPHCLDCGKEWAEPCTRSHYEFYYTGASSGTSIWPNTPMLTEPNVTISCGNVCHHN